ncbi:MFS transporter [Corynebacterium sanguinis]|uniref:MFS transporter n=1 Tax=Corynebacterium sanguinis TaxID=2594913 RepID=UPI00223C4AE4|nr:MFS transporter [Corynebacterium sanguinis]MCT2024066.1 MFS transporter [Corynebacterium sanguinis]
MIALGLAIFNSLHSTQALLPTLSQQLEVSPSVAALSVSAATGVLALCVVPFSILSERYGRGRILIISALAATLVGLALPLAQSAPQLTALRAVQGAMIAGAPAVAMTWLAEEVDDADVPATMGLYVAGTSIGGLSGRLIPSLMLESASWRVVLAATSTISLALAIAVALLLPQQRNFRPKNSIRPSAEIRAMARHLKNPRLVSLYLTAFIGMGVFISMYNFFGYRAVDHFRLPPALAGLVFVMYLSGTWSSARAGAMVRRFGRGRVIAAGATLMLVGALAAGSSTLWLALTGLLVFTASFFAMHSTASGWVGQIAQRDRAEASSMYVLCYYLGSSILGAATGAAFEALAWWGFTAVLPALLAVLVCVSLVPALNRRRRS